MLRNKSAKNEIEKESLQIIDRSQKPKKMIMIRNHMIMNHMIILS